MRAFLFLTLGAIEFAVAGLLAYLGCQLPSSGDVHRSFDGAQRLTDRSSKQVFVLRSQVRDLRRPELQQLANRLHVQTRTVTTTLRAQQVDFDTVRTLRDSMGDVAAGLDGLAGTLDPVRVAKLGDGLGETANFLDQKVAPTAAKAADHLDATTEVLQKDAQRLSALLRDAPLDLKAAREIHDSLARFGQGLDALSNTLRLQRIDVMRDGFRGLEDSLSTGAEQVDRLTSYTYPQVKINGLKAEIEQKQFWPEGEKIAEGMRKAAEGVKEAGKEMDTLGKDLPKLRTSLDESRKVVDRTREALAAALQQQDKIEPLLKDVPQQTARLAESLPQLAGDLARILRETQKLKDVAASLRQAQKGIDMAVERWPELRTTLMRTAGLLKITRDQLDKALEHRAEYEAAMEQTVNLADSFAVLLPLFTEQLDARLAEEERTLTDLGESLDEVSATMPVYAESTSRLLECGRWLAWLVALITGLHGGYLVLGAGLGRRYSG